MTNAKDLYSTLQALQQQAQEIDPCLANKIQKILNWIKNYKIGFLNSKRYVSRFLIEFIQDSVIHINLKSILNEEERISFVEMNFNSVQKYWHGEMFPSWLEKKDIKFRTWKNQLMKGLEESDTKYLQSFHKSISRKSESDSLYRYIADFSMATDIIISYSKHKACCIQLTTSQIKHCGQKIQNWEETLRYWNINKGIFVSFDPNQEVERIVNQILWKASNLKELEYSKLEF
ncbi:MAG: hypothetical protein QNJ36_01200 [Calothrix sp. MO_167.B42]|nr:hypothetical protein [Calothrix sp. MO_167.B42]